MVRASVCSNIVIPNDFKNHSGSAHSICILIRLAYACIERTGDLIP